MRLKGQASLQFFLSRTRYIPLQKVIAEQQAETEFDHNDEPMSLGSAADMVAMQRSHSSVMRSAGSAHMSAITESATSLGAELANMDSEPVQEGLPKCHTFAAHNSEPQQLSEASKHSVASLPDPPSMFPSGK